MMTSSPGTCTAQDTMECGGSRYTYHRDARGSITEITDPSGALVERYAYDVYGTPQFFDSTGNELTASAIGNPFLFTGRQYDAESGNYDYRARVYSPTLGRFLQTDPLGYVDGLNLYAYVGNNPVNWGDPWGWQRDPYEPHIARIEYPPAMMTTAFEDALDLGYSAAEAEMFVFSIASDFAENGEISKATRDAWNLPQDGADALLGSWNAWRNGRMTLGELEYSSQQQHWQDTMALLGALALSTALSSQTCEEPVVPEDYNVRFNLPKASKEANGLIGKDFEDYLVKKLGGTGSFKMGGREFDGAVGNTWYEAKSGRYWEDHAQIGNGFDQFKSDIGARKAIANQNGATYEIHSNTPIPSYVKEWLIKKGIPFTEH